MTFAGSAYWQFRGGYPLVKTDFANDGKWSKLGLKPIIV